MCWSGGITVIGGIGMAGKSQKDEAGNVKLVTEMPPF